MDDFSRWEERKHEEAFPDDEPCTYCGEFECDCAADNAVEGILDIQESLLDDINDWNKLNDWN